MKLVLNSTGYDSVNIDDTRINSWLMFNYVRARDPLHLHYDSWAVYHPDEALPVFEWCENNVQGKCAYHGGKFYFESADDYVMFVLNWA